MEEQENEKKNEELKLRDGRKEKEGRLKFSEAGDDFSSCSVASSNSSRSRGVIGDVVSRQ